MITRKLAGTDLTVSAVALGTALYGAGTGETQAMRLLDLYAGAGGSLIDTAHVYNDWIPGEKGRSEKLIGRWLRSSGMEKGVHIITKGAHPPFEDMTGSRVRESEIRRDAAESLDNLGLGRVDLYLLHRDDPSVPAGEIVEWMNALIREGRIRFWGVSNWTADRIAEANAWASAHGLEGMRMDQAMWSFASIRREGLADQTLVPMDAGLYRYHARSGLNLTAFTSQAKGWFSRRAAGETLPPALCSVYDTPENARRLEFLRRTQRETGLSIEALSLRFFLDHPFTAIPVVGCTNEARLSACLKAFDPAVLPTAIRFPGPV